MRFLLFFLLTVAMLVGLHLVLLYGFVPYSTFGPAIDAANTASELANIPWPTPRLAHNSAGYTHLRETAFFVLAISASALGGWHRTVRCQARRLGHDLHRTSQALARGWYKQPRPIRVCAAGLLLTIAALRTYFLLCTPFNTDEIITVDYFAASSPSVAASFYILPNNHLLQTLLVWVMLHWLPNANPDLMARLPVFILGLVGLVVGFLVLGHLTSIRIALLATLVFQLSPMGLEYATTARGYGLQTLCVQAAALATLVLLRGPAHHRLAWAVWISACLLGTYLIPTFLYPMLSMSGVLLCARSQSARVLRRQVLLAGCGTGGLALLLYLPVGLLTGWPLLFTNPYVMQRPALEFWPVLIPYYLPVTIALLYGRAILVWPLIGLLTLGPVLAHFARPALRPVAWLAWLGVLIPCFLFLAQRVMPPARTLHYTVWLVLLLVGVLVDTLSDWSQSRAMALWSIAAMVAGAYALAQTTRFARTVAEAQQQNQRYQQAEQWLRARAAQRVLSTVPGYELYLAHQVMSRHQLRPVIEVPALQRYRSNGLATNYDFLVLKPTETPPIWLSPHRYRVRFRNSLVRIYQQDSSVNTDF